MMLVCVRPLSFVDVEGMFGNQIAFLVTVVEEVYYSTFRIVPGTKGTDRKWILRCA